MKDRVEAALAALRRKSTRHDFDNWGIVDTACFALFDRTPHAWSKVSQWSKRRGEFQKRAAFALLWGLTVHDKAAEDAKFVEGLGLIEKAATDERHFVKKAVSMALRATGKRNARLREGRAARPEGLGASPRHGALCLPVNRPHAEAGDDAAVSAGYRAWYECREPDEEC